MNSKHARADVVSQRLCDQLLAEVESQVGGLSRNEAASCCSVIPAGHARLYFVYHQRNCISVWPRWGFGEADELHHLALGAGLKTGSRAKRESTWARAFPLNMYIREPDDIHRLMPIMLRSAGALRGLSVKRRIDDDTIAHEIEAPDAFPEGGRRTVVLNAYERSPSARAACLDHYGTSCSVCSFDFEARYGEIGRGFIHVHHLVPIASVGQSYLVDPIRDLRPVCPNCHEMLHRREPPYSIEELRCLVR